MTTTSTFQGMDSGAKPSSRVLAPPGGGSNNIFGFGDDASSRNTQRTQINDASPGKKRNPDNVNFGTHDVLNQGPAESQTSAKPKVPQGAYNPITGEPYPDKKDEAAEPQQEEDKKEEEAKEKEAQAAQPQKKHPSDSSGIFGPAPVQTSTRVTQPPGGRSTKLW